MQTQVVIYSPVISRRLQYVLEYIFTERLGMNWICVADKSQIPSSDTIILNYSTEELESADLNIIPESILFEVDIHSRNMALNRWKHSFVIFYNQPKAAIPFDLFGAVFYFLSRYEEYLPFRKDKHNRFPASASISYQYHFLQQPVIDEWLVQVKNILLGKLPHLRFNAENAGWRLSIDIDLTWKYLHKPRRLVWGGIVKDILKCRLQGLAQRIKVMNRSMPDPFDCFDWIHSRYADPVLYFVLMQSGTPYDRNQKAELPAFRERIRSLSESNHIAIHPSYYSLERDLYTSEIRTLESIIRKPVYQSRQHFIRLSLPQHYRKLIELGIRDDYTMGFADENGFRAGTSRPFYWFDLDKNESTGLLIHPFCYMDATTLFYRKQDVGQALASIERLAVAIRNTNGLFTGIWHNYLIGDTLQYPGQKELFEKSITKLDQLLKN